MKLTIDNIGKIHHADIEINGISIISGENNTGKSTVGRTLFSIFDSLHDIEHKIRIERTESIVKSLIINLSYSLISSSKGLINNFAEQIVSNKDIYIKDYNALFEEIKNFAYSIPNQKESILIDNINNTTLKIQEIIKLSDKEILESYTYRCLNMEFSNQIRNIYSNEQAKIKLTIKDDDIKITLNDDEFKIENPISLLKDAIYIDDPSILDDTTNDYFHLASFHREHLRKILLSNNKNNIVDELLINKKFDEIYNILDTVCDGNIEKNKNGLVTYKKKGSSKALNFAVLSTGLKSFIILKTLIQKGAIENNGIVILDEPEVHLHPKWQLLFAKLIVLLHKEFDLHVLLNTHSPYFLRAIEVYSAKYKVADKCKYYLSDFDGEFSVINDVSDKLDKLYEKLYLPLETLDDEESYDF